MATDKQLGPHQRSDSGGESDSGCRWPTDVDDGMHEIRASNAGISWNGIQCGRWQLPPARSVSVTRVR
jgi:hypothetical protein